MSIAHAVLSAWFPGDDDELDDRPPPSLDQQIAIHLRGLEQMAVLTAIARVVGHEMQPAEWADPRWTEHPSLVAYCGRCAVGKVMLDWYGGDWASDLSEALEPCRPLKEQPNE